MKTMVFWKSVGLAAMAAIFVAGCGSGSTDSSSQAAGGTTTTTTGGAPAPAAGAKKSIKITMIAKSSSNPVFLSAQKGAEAAAKELSKDGRTVSIDWQTPNTEDGQVQAQRIAAAVNQGADAILISCSDAAKVNGAINDAVAKGILVMTFDSDAPESKRFAFYGADDTAVGTEVMDKLESLSPNEQLNVAILAGNQNAPNLQKRSKAVIEEAKKFKNVKIVGTFNHAETPQDASAEVVKDNNAHPEINAWAMVGGWPLFSTSLLTLDPKHYKIVSVDALPAELAYVDKGIAPILLAQPVYDWGFKSVGFIVDKIDGKDVPQINKMDLVEVNKDSLGTWAQQLKTWGFTDVDPKFLAAAPKK
jgi:ribose transport system substrate-binding protein